MVVTLHVFTCIAYRVSALRVRPRAFRCPSIIAGRKSPGHTWRSSLREQPSFHRHIAPGRRRLPEDTRSDRASLRSASASTRNLSDGPSVTLLETNNANGALLVPRLSAEIDFPVLFQLFRLARMRYKVPPNSLLYKARVHP